MKKVDHSIVAVASIPLALLAVGCINIPDLDEELGSEETGLGEDSADTGETGETGAPGSSDDAADGSDTGDQPVEGDPAPWCNEPGECTCEGCPDSDISTVDVPAGAATSWPFSGAVVGAEGNGEFFIIGPDGRTVGGEIATDPASGTFQFTAPLFCGEQLVKCLWSNEAGTYVLVTRVITEDCVEPDIRVTLSWDELGDDFELHLIRPGGKINTSDDCTWTTCMGTGPDWGEPGDPSDDPRKDIDNTGNFGPENIFLAKPEDGVYTVMVEHWGGGDPNAPGTVTFNVAGETITVDIGALAPQHVWTAGTIEWPSGTVTTAQDIYDCTTSWSGGCTAPIP